MVDLHILTRPGDRKDWMDECLESLKDEPVTIHRMDGIDGDTASARTRAFQLGDSPYVTFVDPDDVVVPGIVSELVGVLERNPKAVMSYSDQILIDEAGAKIRDGWSTDPEPFYQMGWPIQICRQQGQYIHHLMVMRRESVERCLPLRSNRIPESILVARLANLGWLIHVPVVGYKWRQHSGNTFTTYTETEFNEARQLLHINTSNKGDLL